MRKITMLKGLERARRCNDEERERIVAEAFSPVVIVSAVARTDIAEGPFDLALRLGPVGLAGFKKEAAMTREITKRPEPPSLLKGTLLQRWNR